MIADVGSRGANDYDALGKEPPGHESEYLFRRVVEPMRVVYDQCKRLLFRGLSEDRQRGESYQEAVQALALRSARRPLRAPRAAGPAVAQADRASGRRLGGGCCKRARPPTSTPTAWATRQPRSRSRKWPSNALLPMPASPRRVKTRLCPARASVRSPSSASHSAWRPRSVGRPLGPRPAVVVEHVPSAISRLEDQITDPIADAPELRNPVWTHDCRSVMRVEVRTTVAPLSTGSYRSARLSD